MGDAFEVNSAPRRVTIVAHELRGFRPAGGMGTATAFLALALARMGHSVEILLGIDSPESIEPYWQNAYDRAGIRLRRAPRSDEPVEPWHFVHSHSIALGLRADPPDVVVAHDLGGPAYPALQLREAGVAFQDTLFVIFCHGPRAYLMDMRGEVGVRDLRNLLAVTVHEQGAVELADVVVSPSAYLVDWMREQGWRLPERTLVIPHFTQSAATAEPASMRTWEEGERLERLAFFGRPNDRKGVKPFAEALNALEPQLLGAVALEFVGKPTATWPPERVEALLSEQTRRALRGVSFATDLDRHEALTLLSRPGTLAVMPSLQENSPATVAECLEHGIPFIASDVGGTAELIAPDDRARVLFTPTAAGVEAALRRVLADGRVPRPAEPAHTSEISYERWGEVVELRAQPRTWSGDGRVDVIVVRRNTSDATACLSALERQTYTNFGVSVVDRREAHTTSAPYVVFLDADDVPDEKLLRTLVDAQRASGADAVTCGVRLVSDEGEPTLHFFTGEPRSLGVLSNGYGTVALIRRDALGELTTEWPAERDADWPLLAALDVSGKRIVSVPLALVTRNVRSGSVERDPGDALLVLDQVERTLAQPLRGTARLAAGLAADTARVAPPRRTRKATVAILALTAFALALRLATLGRQSYWYDELVTVSLLHRSFGAMLHAVPRSEATPYVYYVLAWPWSRLFGFGEAGLRSLSAIAGALTVPVTYAAGARLVSRRVGLIAAALVVVNPFLVWYSQEARAYALFAFFAALSFYFFVGALRGERRSLVGWALASALAVATHYFAVFVVAAEAGWLLVRLRRRALLAAALPTAVMLAEIPLMLKQRPNGGNISASPLAHRIAGTAKDLVVGYSFPAELAGTVAAFVLVLAGVAMALRRLPVFVAAGVAAFALVVPVLLALAGADYVIARNFVAVVVPGAIFLGAGYATRRLGAVAAALLVALSLAIVVAVAADTRYGRTDWRGAARAIGPPAVVRAIVVTPTIDSTLWRPYLGGLTEPATANLRTREVDVLGLATQGGFSAGVVHPPRTPPRPAPPGFRLVATQRTPTVVLVRYRSPSVRSVPTAELAALKLSPLPAAVFLQGPNLSRR